MPLSILDLAPILSGGTAGEAVRRSQPALLLGQIAAVTDHVRLGSGAVQTVTKRHCPSWNSSVRFDLGLGRSGQRRQEALTSSARRLRRLWSTWSTGC